MQINKKKMNQFLKRARHLKKNTNDNKWHVNDAQSQ